MDPRTVNMLLSALIPIAGAMEATTGRRRRRGRIRTPEQMASLKDLRRQRKQERQNKKRGRR